MRKKLYSLLGIVAGLMCISCAAFAEVPVPVEFDPTTIIVGGQNAIVALLVKVAPLLVGAMVVIFGWKFGMKLFKKMGKSV